jgi:hypothetical protein
MGLNVYGISSMSEIDVELKNFANATNFNKRPSLDSFNDLFSEKYLLNK